MLPQKEGEEKKNKRTFEGSQNTPQTGVGGSESPQIWRRATKAKEGMSSPREGIPPPCSSGCPTGPMRPTGDAEMRRCGRAVVALSPRSQSSGPLDPSRGLPSHTPSFLRVVPFLNTDSSSRGQHLSRCPSPLVTRMGRLSLPSLSSFSPLYCIRALKVSGKAGYTHPPPIN